MDLRHVRMYWLKQSFAAGGRLIGFHTGNPHVLGYQRLGSQTRLLCLANFHDDWQVSASEKQGQHAPSG